MKKPNTCRVAHGRKVMLNDFSYAAWAQRIVSHMVDDFVKRLRSTLGEKGNYYMKPTEFEFQEMASDLEDTLVNDRFADGMHAVPPPMIGNYMPYVPDVEIDYSKFTYGPKQTSADESDSKPSEYAFCESDSSVETSTSMLEPVENASKVVCEPKVRTDAPIIEEYESDSDNDSVSNVQEDKERASFTFTDSVKHDDPHRDLKDKIIVDSEFSRHMTGNKAHLADYQEFKGGCVPFGGSNGRITGKGKIKTGSKELASPKHMDLGKDISNPLMAGRLPKTTLPTRIVLEVVTAAKLITEVVTTAGATITAEATKIEQDEAFARQLEAELNADINWNAVIEQVKISKRLNDAVMKYQALKRKPLTEAQERKNMIIYLKNMVGYKMNYFKGITYSDIRPLFEKNYNYNQAFLEEVNEEVTVTEKEVEVEGHKREGESLEKEIAKKKKIDEEA
nr:hypothetical protein [Tanacetum cinerariifolium]